MKAVVLVLAFLVAAPGWASIVTFDEVPIGANQLITTISEGGFTFTGTPASFWQVTDPAACLDNGGCADNGTQYVGDTFGNIITMSSGGAFTLVSFDASELFLTGPYADEIVFLGHLNGGGVVSTSFVLDGVVDGVGGSADFETFFLPSTFVNLTSVEISGYTAAPDTPAFFGIDNVVTTPEPSTYLLVGLGLAACGIIRRKYAK